MRQQDWHPRIKREEFLFEFQFEVHANLEKMNMLLKNPGKIEARRESRIIRINKVIHVFFGFGFNFVSFVGIFENRIFRENEALGQIGAFSLIKFIFFLGEIVPKDRFPMPGHYKIWSLMKFI